MKLENLHNIPYSSFNVFLNQFQDICRVLWNGLTSNLLNCYNYIDKKLRCAPTLLFHTFSIAMVK